MARVYVSIGSNIDPETNVREALERLEAMYGTLTVSSVYRSRAVGFEGPDFLNLVVGLDTDTAPHDVKVELKTLENDLGRVRRGLKFDSRTIDLDLILYDDVCVDESGLRLPSDDIGRYAFVLVPLAEIAGDVVHPELGRTIGELRSTLAEGADQFVSVRPPSTLKT